MNALITFNHTSPGDHRHITIENVTSSHVRDWMRQGYISSGSELFIPISAVRTVRLIPGVPR